MAKGSLFLQEIASHVFAYLGLYWATTKSPKATIYMCYLGEFDGLMHYGRGCEQAFQVAQS
jgi:hypothetical protein